MKNLDELYKKLDYNTIRKVLDFKRKYSLIYSIGSTFTMAGLTINAVCGGGLNPLFFTLIGLQFTNSLITISLPNNIHSTDGKDIQELKLIYEDILKEYNKLNNTLEFKHPLEVFELFVITYGMGYLSCNKEFKYCDYGFIDISFISGINVINGKGLCRHITSMLCDIYRNCDIENMMLGIANDTSLEYANHAINVVKYNNGCYYLDPTNSRFYTKVSDELLKNEMGLSKIIFGTIMQDSLLSNGDEMLKNIIALPHLDVNDNEDIILKSGTQIIENVDLLEKFYNENKDKYEDISNKILTLKQGDPYKRII